MKRGPLRAAPRVPSKGRAEVLPSSFSPGIASAVRGAIGSRRRKSSLPGADSRRRGLRVSSGAMGGPARRRRPSAPPGQRSGISRRLGRQLAGDGELTPGKCTFLCTVPGDADGGMKGELTVKSRAPLPRERGCGRSEAGCDVAVFARSRSREPRRRPLRSETARLRAVRGSTVERLWKPLNHS